MFLRDRLERLRRLRPPRRKREESSTSEAESDDDSSASEHAAGAPPREFAPLQATVLEAFAPLEGLAAHITAGGRADSLAACPSDMRNDKAYAAALRLIRGGRLAWFHARIPDEVELRAPARKSRFARSKRARAAAKAHKTQS